MKKIIISFLFSLCVSVTSAMTERVVTFDFTKMPEMSFTPSINFSSLSNSGQVMNITDYSIFLSPITISFSNGSGTLGASIYRINDYYSLMLRSFCEIIFETSGGYQITSIKFNNTNSIGSCTPGRFDTQQNEWSPNGASNVTKVTLTNGFSDSQITTVTVKYLSPATPLSLYSSNPANDATVLNSFSSIRLNYNTTISSVNSDGIVLSGSGFSGTKPMTASYSGSTITLSLNNPLTIEGQYSINVPQGVFCNTEGAYNDAFTLNFTLIVNRATFQHDGISPSPGTEHVYETLPSPITIKYPKPVKLNDDRSDITIMKDGTAYMSCKLKVSNDDAKSVLIVPGSNLKDAGIYSMTIPEGAIHTTFYDTASSANDEWNPEFQIVYSVEDTTPPDPLQTLKDKAKDMLQKSLSGLVGYPMVTSATYLALTALVSEGSTPTEEELTTAISNYFNETDVITPALDKWYTIAGINDKGEKIYLIFNENKTGVRLGRNASSAAAFQVISVDEGKVVFKTKEGFFLHIPMNLPNYVGTSSKNLTDSQTDINILTLAKFQASSVDNASSEALFGTFTIYGSLGTKNDVEKSAYALLNFEDMTIDTDPDMGLIFNSIKSSAFVFSETTEPGVVVEYVYPSVGLVPSGAIANAGDELFLQIVGPTSTEIVDSKKIYYKQNNQSIFFSEDILTPSGTTNKFVVNTKGLEPGVYTLMMEEGCFSYTVPFGYSVREQDLSINITIQGSGSNPDPQPNPTVTPTATLSTTTAINAGDELVLTIENVIEATLVGRSWPYYIYADGDKTGNRVPFSGEILKEKTESTTKFDVLTTGLSAGNYTLIIPKGTFSYIIEQDKSLNDIELQVNISIQESGANPNQEDFSYTYSNIVFVTTKYRNQHGIDYISDVDLNDLVLFVHHAFGYSDFIGSSESKVFVRSAFGGNVVSGHLESFPEVADVYGSDYIDGWALKFVPDVPVEAGQLKNNPGMYGYYFEAGAFGDANYGLWLQDHNSVSPKDCIVNPGMSGPKYFVNNTWATGIENINSNKPESTSIVYDLQGRKVSDSSRLTLRENGVVKGADGSGLPKGIYIVNGKRVVIK